MASALQSSILDTGRNAMAIHHERTLGRSALKHTRQLLHIHHDRMPCSVYAAHACMLMHTHARPCMHMCADLSLGDSLCLRGIRGVEHALHALQLTLQLSHPLQHTHDYRHSRAVAWYKATNYKYHTRSQNQKRETWCMTIYLQAVHSSSTGLPPKKRTCTPSSIVVPCSPAPRA